MGASLPRSFLGGQKREQRPSLISGWSELVSLGWSHGEASWLAVLPGRELVTEDLKMYLSWSVSQSANHCYGAMGVEAPVADLLLLTYYSYYTTSTLLPPPE